MLIVRAAIFLLRAVNQIRTKELGLQPAGLRHFLWGREWPCPNRSPVFTGAFRRSGLLILLDLGGCVAQAQPEARFVRVEVPVQVPCHAPDDGVPTWAVAGLRKNARGGVMLIPILIPMGALGWVLMGDFAQ